jgi:hypothetical protein
MRRALDDVTATTMAKMKNKNPLRGTYSVHYNDVADSPAFNAMRPLCQLLVMKAKRFYRRDAQGPIHMSARTAAKLVKTRLTTALSLCREAVHYGFWRLHVAGHLGSAGKGAATTYQLTDEMFKGRRATLDFLKWDGTPFNEQKTPAYYKRRERALARLNAHKAKLKAGKNDGKNNHKKTKPRTVSGDTPVSDTQDTPVLCPDTAGRKIH